MKLSKILLGLVVVLFVLGFVLNRIATSQLNPEKLEELLESELRADVSLESVKVSPFIFPKSVSLQKIVFKEFILSSEDQPVIAAEELKLSVGLMALFKKEIRVEDFTLRQPEIHLRLREDGSSNLEDLFEKPFTSDDENETAEEKQGNDAEDYGEFVGRLDQAEIIDGRVVVLIEKTGTRLEINKMNARLHEIRVDPAALGQTNEADLELSGLISVKHSSAHLPPYLGLHLDGSSRVKLFDPETNDLSPVVQARVRILEGSYLDTRIPILEKVAQELQRIEKVGVKTLDIPDKIAFGGSQDSAYLAGSYDKGKMTLNEPLGFDLGGWRMKLNANSWINIKDEEHEITAALLAPNSLSSKAGEALGKLDKFIPKELGRETGLTKDLFSDERLSLKLSSSGHLKKPKVRPDYSLPDTALKKKLQEKLDEKASGLLEKLLD